MVEWLDLLVKLGNDLVTAVRQRLARTHHGRRDPAWAHRTLLLRGAHTLTPCAWERLEAVFRTDDPTDGLSAVWGSKEQLSRLPSTDTLTDPWDERMRMGYFAQIANMPEATKLYDTVVTWWNTIEVLIPRHRSARVIALTQPTYPISTTRRGQVSDRTGRGRRMRTVSLAW